MGHREDSRHFGGDVCRERISFVRNFVFRDINTLRNDPWMLYRSAHHPFVHEWFSASDGIDLQKFIKLASERNQDRLMEEDGACTVYTHMAFGFTCNCMGASARFVPRSFVGFRYGGSVTGCFRITGVYRRACPR